MNDGDEEKSDIMLMVVKLSFVDVQIIWET